MHYGKQVWTAVLLIAMPLMSFQLWDPAKSDSAVSAYKKASAGLSTPESKRRKQERREVQRHGYTSTLLQVVRQDGISALIAYARMRLQIEYSLDQAPIYYKASAEFPGGPSSALLQSYTFGSEPVYIAIPEDWSFPRDPWKKED